MRAAAGPHPRLWCGFWCDQSLETFFGLLVGEIAVLAVATVGAIWIDHVAGERIRRERAARDPDAPGADEP